MLTQEGPGENPSQCKLGSPSCDLILLGLQFELQSIAFSALVTATSFMSKGAYCPATLMSQFTGVV